MLRKALIGFGIVYILLAVYGLGLLWTDPNFSEGHLLFGKFRHDIIHDLVHLISGIVALGVAATGSQFYARLYFQVFGAVYALVAIVGFVQGHTVLGIFGVDLADNLLHVAIAVSSLALGFFTKKVDDRVDLTTPPGK
jgi:hypothetical protein